MPARTGSIKKRRSEGAAADQWVAQVRASAGWWRELNGNEAEFAVLSNKGPARPGAPGELEKTGLCEASQCPTVEHRRSIPESLQTSCSCAISDG